MSDVEKLIECEKGQPQHVEGLHILKQFGQLSCHYIVVYYLCNFSCVFLVAMEHCGVMCISKSCHASNSRPG